MDGAKVVIVNLHWGNEYVAQPSSFQLRLARRLTRSPDITAIVGQHVHVVQPIRIIHGKPVVFGEGNLISNQTSACCPAASQDGMIVLLTITVDSRGARVTFVHYVPIWVRHPDFVVLPAGTAWRTDSADAAALRASYRRTVAVAGRGPRIQPIPGPSVNGNGHSPSRRSLFLLPDRGLLVGFAGVGQSGKKQDPQVTDCESNRMSSLATEALVGVRRIWRPAGMVSAAGSCRSSGQEFVRHPHELVGVRPDERVVSAIDDDELRTRDAVVEHLRVVDRYRLVVRGGDDERRTSDLGQAAPAVERHRLPPRRHHQLAVLVRHEASEPVGTFLAELLRAL